MPHLGVTELLIILVIVIVLFGAGRIARLGGELGQAVGNFRKGLDSAKDENEKVAKEEGTKA
jgi:sec-independent protein translocase protein TatA